MTENTAPKPGWLHRLYRNRPLRISVGVLLFYLLFGFLVLPAILKWQVEKQVPALLGQQATIGEVRFNPLALRLEVDQLALRSPQGAELFGFGKLLVDFELRSIIDRAWHFAKVELAAPSLRFALQADGSHNFSPMLERLAADAGEPAPEEPGGLPRFIVRQFTLSEGRVEYADQALDEPLITRIEPLSLTIDELTSLPDRKAQLKLSLRTAASETLGIDGELALAPLSASGLLTLEGLQMDTVKRALSRAVALEQAAGNASLSARFSVAMDDQGVLSATLPKTELGLDQLALGVGGQSTELEALALDVKDVLLHAGASPMQLDVGGIEASLANVRLADASGGLSLPALRLSTQDVALANEAGTLKLTGHAARIGADGLQGKLGEDRIGIGTVAYETLSFTLEAAAETRLTIAQAALNLEKIDARALGAKEELARLASARLDAEAVVLALAPEAPAQVQGEGLSLALSGVALRSPADGSELLELGSAKVDGTRFALAERSVRIASLALADARVTTALDARGRLNWLALAGGGEAEAAAAQDETGPWRVALDTARLDGIAVDFRDAGHKPTFALGIRKLGGTAKGIDSGGDKPIQLDLKAALASGGRLSAKGGVHADGSSVDLRLKLDDIALAPAQTFLSEFAALKLASGTASANGRLRYGKRSGAKALVAYDGGLSVDKLLLEESKLKRPFFAWESLASDDIDLTVEPNRLDIGELRLNGPAGKVVIAEDLSINLMDVVKKGEDAGADSPAPAGAEPAAFPLSIARLQVADGEIDFADLSLTPRFAARMHELKGVISGLGTDPESRAGVKLDARVDEFGSATIGGQLSLMQPERFTQIDMAFRNLAMTSLSPYVVKFAGRSIESGRLELDLGYHIENSKLKGSNKVVLKDMKLGGKVDSPGAADLPLDLALAILRDSEGVIDIGLPVSGDLDDPKFDYGTVIGKAISNLIVGIVTAPFRALGAIFGSGDKALDSIDFAPGSHAVEPPEREKLQSVARALNERPSLKLAVPAGFAPERDAAALKSLAVRSDLVRRIGVTLKSGEDPGPIDTTSQKAREALEAAFGERFGMPALVALEESAERAAAAAKSDRLPPAHYRGLAERLIEAQPLSDESLPTLARRRGEAIVTQLTGEGGVPADRVALGKPAAISTVAATTVSADTGEAAPAAAPADGDGPVSLKLELKVAR